MPDSQFGRGNPDASLNEQAYARIRDRILSGEFPPGTPLTRRPLAQRLGMSLIPVAQALQRLEADGLVESLPRIGTRVRIPTPEDVRGHYNLREALETHVARLFAESASPSARRELRVMAQRLDAMYSSFSREQPDWRQRLFEVHRSHAEFHMRVAQATGCKPLVEALERSHVLIFNWRYNAAAQFEELPPQWHGQLMEVLASGSPEKAVRAMRRHVRFGMDRVIGRIEVYAARQSPTCKSYRGPQQRTLARNRR